MQFWFFPRPRFYRWFHLEGFSLPYKLGNPTVRVIQIAEIARFCHAVLNAGWLQSFFDSRQAEVTLLYRPWLMLLFTCFLVRRLALPGKVLALLGVHMARAVGTDQQAVETASAFFTIDGHNTVGALLAGASGTDINAGGFFAMHAEHGLKADFRRLGRPIVITINA